MIYEVCSGIPVPRRASYGFWVRLAAAMKEGDSVVVKTKRDMLGLRRALNSNERAYVKSRSEEGDNIRVWRLGAIIETAPLVKHKNVGG